MRIHFLIPILLGPLFAACQSASIESERQEGYDFSPLRTYQWVTPEAAGIDRMSDVDRQVSKGLARIVAEELERRGYVRGEREPDFLVLVATTTRRGVRRGGAPPGGRSRSRLSGSSFRYEEGVIVVRAWERERGLLIWDCWARDAIKESEPPTEEGVIEIVRKMMARFPAEVPAAKRK